MESDLSLWEEKLEGRANISSTANYYVADKQLRAAAPLTAHQQLPSRAAGPLTSHQQLASRGAPPLTAHQQLASRGAVPLTCPQQIANRAAGLLTSHQQLASRGAVPLTCPQQIANRAAGLLTLHQQLANRGAPPLSCPQQLASGRTPVYLLTYPTEQQTTGVDGLLHSYLPEQTPSTPSTIVIEGVPYFYLMPAVIAGGQDAHVYESFASE